VRDIPPPSDGELWAAATAGSSGAFGVLFDRHARAVYNHCFRLTASWTAAEDHTQNTFLLAWHKRASVALRNDSALPWLLAVATNMVRGERRSVRRRLRLAEQVPADRPIEDHADEVAQRLDDERRMARVLAATQSLPRGEREAVALCVWSQVSYADAAAVLGIAEVSVRSRVSRARSRLAGLLAEPPVELATTIMEDR
jgi:RNA polymerase sigma-70 factor (ECF subfamily)